MASDITKATYDSIARKWSDEHFELAGTESDLAKFIGYLRKGEKVLDAGCGPGKHVKMLMDEGFDAVGIDFSKSMLSEAKKRVPKGTFKLMDMRKLLFKDNTFDGIWCFASILHIRKEDAPTVMSEFNRVIKDKGILIISMKRGTGEAFEGTSKNKRFFSYYAKSDAEKLITDSGFKMAESYTEKLGNTVWIVIIATAQKHN